MINKPSIIISSLGRTGTTFFQNFFTNNFPNISAFHEPASIRYNSLKFFEEIKFNIINFGFYNSFIKKTLGKWGLLNLSKKRILNKINNEKAILQILNERKKFIEKQNAKYPEGKNVYLESNYHYYGLLDILPFVFKNLRIIFIIRDPRNWIRSNINFKLFYHFSDTNMYLGNRLNAKMFQNDPYQKKWKSFSQFEKLAWAWNKQNSFAIESLEKIQNVPKIENKNIYKIFKFEDLFSDKNDEEFKNLINFINELNPEKKESYKKYKNSIHKKIHQPKNYKFPKWQKWTSEEAQIVEKHCGDLMRKFGYGKEPEWLKLINRQ